MLKISQTLQGVQILPMPANIYGTLTILKIYAKENGMKDSRFEIKGQNTRQNTQTRQKPTY